MKLEDEIKQKEFKSEYHKAMVNMIFTSNWLDANSKKFGVTSQQFNILRILRGAHPEPCTINMLRDRMLDKNCDASRIVERLRLKGVLDRKTCPEDRRSVDIIITKKGLDLLSKADKEEPAFYKILQTLTPTEAKQLNKLLDKLRG